MPEFRKDFLVDRWVIIAGERARRPGSRLAPVDNPTTDVCPFCAGNETMTPPPTLVVFNKKTPLPETNWSVRVVPNKYPALLNQEVSTPRAGPYAFMNGGGIHEVVIESPSHVTGMAALNESGIQQVLYAYQQRLLRFRADARWRYALIYKNHGAEAGATLAHSHSQIVALPMVPTEPSREIDAAGKYFASAGRCAYCDLMQRESELTQRIVAENDRFIVFCPFASRVAGETWILPKRHSAIFEAGSDGDYLALARSLRETLLRLARCFDEPAFNYFFHGSPLDAPENEYNHWHLEILPKLHHCAGFEWGSGCYINPLAPEDAAGQLREIVL